MEKVLRSMKTSLRGSKAAWKYFLRPISISNHLLFLFLSRGYRVFGTHKMNVKINTSTSNQYLVPSPWGYAEGQTASRSCSSWPRSRGRGWSSCPQRGWTGRPLPSSGSGSGSLAPGWSNFVIFEILLPPAQEIQKVNCANVEASNDHFLSLRMRWSHLHNNGKHKVTRDAGRLPNKEETLFETSIAQSLQLQIQKYNDGPPPSPSTHKYKDGTRRDLH